jgi:hypothetical protein
MKYFETMLRIRVGEYEFNYPKIVEAKNVKEATEKVRKYASTFYDDKSDEDYPNSFTFFSGCPIVEILYISGITKEQWLEAQWERGLI